MKRPKVLDSWAIMAFLGDEPAAEIMERIILSSQEGGSELIMSTVNLGEVWYNLARVSSDMRADEATQQIRRLGIIIVDVDWELTRRAAVYKARNRMAYADCFAAALAKQRKAELVTGDKEFKQVEDEIKILWL